MQSGPWTRTKYGYDTMDRLNAATSVPLQQTFTFDGDGNRMSQSGSYTDTFTGTLSYDDAGRLTAMQQTGSGQPLTFIYNALGQRIHKASPTLGSTIFVYDEAGHLLGEYDDAGHLIEEMVWLGDIPVASLRPDGGGGVAMYYVHTDHLNAPRKISRPSDNALVWRWDPDAFGNGAPNQSPAGLGTFVSNLRFPGQYYDAETGLNYNMARDYDSTTGRYVESDPIGLQGGGNTYTYAQDAPTMTYDPDGQDAIAYMMQHPLGLGDGPSWLSPAVKNLICKTINDCAGNMNCVFNTLNKARRKNWFDPVLRQAENFATAAADDSVTGYPLSWAAHNSLGVWWYQYQTKPAMIRNHSPTTPVSDDAYAAGIAGVYFHSLDPSVAQKWCSKDCKK